MAKHHELDLKTPELDPLDPVKYDYALFGQVF
jgi:hypothetical protein